MSAPRGRQPRLVAESDGETMRLSCTAIQVCARDGLWTSSLDARSAVSLHSHSNCSRETLDFVPVLGSSIPIVSRLLAQSVAGYERKHGRPLDFSDYFWRPPLSAAAVIESERRHLEERLDHPALVSLTDHDTLEGPRRLRAEGRDDVPLSLEWSVPFEGTVFHLGVHALTAARASEAERAMAGFTNCGEGEFAEICDWLIESPQTFIVLNHPYWDLPRRGGLQHDSALLAFLRRHRDRVHALELNGYRSWAENRRVLPLAEGFELPVVGGGDRHGLSPNTIVNLTAATSLEEFALELREGRPTNCVIFPEYLQPFNARLVQGTCECVSPVADQDGRLHTWADRVFTTIDGTDTPISEIWTDAPIWLHAVIGLTKWLGSRALTPVFQLADSGGGHELESDLSRDFFITTGRAVGRSQARPGVRGSLSGVAP